MTGDTGVLWRRAVAHVLDSATPALLGLPLASLFPGDAATVAFFSLWLGIGLLDFLVLQGLTGFTLGKWLLGIRTVNAAGLVPGLLAALKRNLPLLLEATYLIGIFAIWSHPHGQRFGDRWARTYVVRAPRRGGVARPVGLTG